MVKYSEARPLICEGDLIETKKPHGLFGFLTKRFTGMYTHCGIATWMNDGLWMVEINGGKNHAIPMSQLENEPFDVYEPPHEIAHNRELIRQAAIESIRVRKSYGYLGTVAIGIIEYFKLSKNKFINNKFKDFIVCSGYCVQIYNKAGWSFSDTLVSPTKLSTMLNKKLEVN